MITVTITLDDFDHLTAPMWDACGLECPVMIGGTCRKDDYRFCTLPKFDTAAAEVLYSWDASEQCGNSTDGPAWYGLFRNPDVEEHDGPMGAGAIVTEYSGGSVYAVRYASAAELDKVWQELLIETDDTEGDDE